MSTLDFQKTVDLNYHSVLEQMPNGELVTSLKLQLGEDKFLEVANDLWEISLNSLYVNLSEEAQTQISELIDKKDYESVNNLLTTIFATSPTSFDLFGKGLKLAVKTIAKENNITL